METIQLKLHELGLNTPSKRMLTGLAAGMAVAWMIQPKLMFENGKPRPFACVSDPKKGEPLPTNWPWWLIPVSVATAIGLFL